MNSKYNWLPLLSCCLLLAGTVSSAQETTTSATPEAKAADPEGAVSETFATVNGDVITTGMYRIYYLERMRETGNPNTVQFRARITDELVKMRLLAEEAEKAKLDQRPAVMAALAVARDRILSQVAMDEHARNVQPPAAEVKRRYEERYGNHPGKEYKVRHIVVATRDEAEGLIRQLDEGADFAALATAASTGSTGPVGGDLGWVDVEQMVEPFRDQVKAMEKGAYTKQPVQTHLGWHVILLEDVRSADPPTFEEVEPSLISELQQQAVGGYVGELARGAKVEFNERYVKTKPASTEPPAASEPAGGPTGP